MAKQTSVVDAWLNEQMDQQLGSSVWGGMDTGLKRSGADALELMYAQALKDRVNELGFKSFDIDKWISRAKDAGYFDVTDFEGTNLYNNWFSNKDGDTKKSANDLMQQVIDNAAQWYNQSNNESYKSWNNTWKRIFNGSDAASSMAYIYSRTLKYLNDSIENSASPYDENGNFAGTVNPDDVISNAQAPDYINLSNLMPTIEDVDPMKWWRADELADLHGIDFNLENYYDLIKQGTSAELERALNEAGRIGTAARRDEARQAAAYLDSLRNEKAAARNAGLTAGAQAANEIMLANDDLNSYADNLLAAVGKQVSAVDDAMLQDAGAYATAHNFFENLAKSLGDVSGYLYKNDANRYSADWTAQAERFAADSDYAGHSALENANRYAGYVQSQANRDLYKGQIAGANNEYKQIYGTFFNKFMNDYNGNTKLATAEANNAFKTYFYNGYTGVNTLKDFLNNYNK